MKKLAIFDLDGTLLDTVQTIAHYANFALEHFGLPTNAVKEYNYFAGNGVQTLIHKALGAHNLDTEENYNRVLPYYLEHYNRDTTFKTAHFNGMPETLKEMKKKGVTLAIVSNKPNSSVQPVVEQFFEKELFAYVQGAVDGYPHKPNPYFVNEIIKKCGVSKEEVLYVGDTGTDMETGRNANVLTVGVLWGFRDEAELKNSGAHKIIQKPQELLKLL